MATVPCAIRDETMRGYQCQPFESLRAIAYGYCDVLGDFAGLD
jgi:hypothetical protein